MLPTKIHTLFMKREMLLFTDLFGFLKWKRICRLNLACFVEMDGAKMLHLPFFELDL